MAYVDLASIQATDPGSILTAAWCDQTRDNLEFLINPPACSAFNSVVQSVPNATNTTLTANSENFDNDSMHSLISQTSRITVQTSGRYLFIANVLFAANAGTRIVTAFFLNGTTFFQRDNSPPIGGATADQKTAVMTRVMAQGDFMEVQVNHNNGANLNVTLVEFFAMFLTR